MISWLCFVKASLLCKEDKKIQTHIVEKICKQYTKRIKEFIMKKLLKRIALVILFITTCSNIYTGPSIVHAQPPYAKWGKLAVEKTKEQYPKAEIIDYLHIGRKPKTVQITVEKFKLWLREDGKEYGVFVDVEFETKSEKFIKMSFQKTSR